MKGDIYLGICSLNRNKLLGRLCLSFLVAAWAIMPPRREHGGESGPGKTISLQAGVAATMERIRYYLEDLNRGVDARGEMKLLFPGCLAFAAPFLLYRLKRCGFSQCRVLMSGEGLLVTASR